MDFQSLKKIKFSFHVKSKYIFILNQILEKGIPYFKYLLFFSAVLHNF